MKHNIAYRLSVGLCAGIMLAGCELTKIPEDTISPELFLKNAAQMEMWTNEFYNQLNDAESTASISADDNIGNSIGEIMMGQRTAANESGWTWNRLRDINYFLQHSSNCNDAAVRGQYEGVALFHRAYFYYVKVRRYGDVPWYNQVIGSADTKLLFRPRDSREYVMQNIMDDLDKATSDGYLPTKHDLVHVTRWTALALKSRIALFEGTFRKYHGIDGADKYLKLAAEAADEFMKNSGYSLAKSGDTPYRTLFNSFNADPTEVVLARKYDVKASVTHGVQFLIINNRQGFTRRYMNHYLMADGSYFSARPGYETMEFKDEVANRDPRLSQTVLCPGYIQKGGTQVLPNTLNALTGYQPIKYVGEVAYDGANKSYVDFPLFRSAEVYLNYAEAKAELGTLTQDDLDRSINLLRDRVGMPKLEMDKANSNPDPLMKDYYPNVTKSANTGVILEIRRERTIELCMEGFRIWDIMRWKEGMQLTRPFYGCYFHGEGEYDMDGDGQADLLLYTSDKGSFKGTVKKLDQDVILTNGTSGYIHALKSIPVKWNEDRDYLYPIPASERVITRGALTQNPGWNDGVSFQ